MPKAQPKSSTTMVRYAPYMPLRGAKVNSQLGPTKEDELLRQAVQCLGGTMVGIQHGVDYIVANPGTAYGDFDVSEAMEDFIDKHTNIYDSLIFTHNMFERLNERMAHTMPVNCKTLTFRNTVYPIRAPDYTELGRSLNFGITRLPGVAPEETLEPEAEVDIVALRYKKNERDVWKSTEVVRFQICKASNFYVVGYMEEKLFDAVHTTSALGTRFTGSSPFKYDTLDEAKTCLSNHFTQPNLKVDCDDVVVGMKVKDEDDYFTEVFEVKNKVY